MNECKHPSEFVSNLGDKRLCSLCGAHLPLEDKKQKAQHKEEPKIEEKQEAKPKKKTKKNID